MEFKWEYLTTVLATVLLLINGIECVNEINSINIPTSLTSSSSSSEEDNSDEKFIIRNNNKIIRESVELENINEILRYSTTTEKPSETSKTAMDIITIVWYTSTFLALAAFFFLMACSDRKCGRRNESNNTIDIRNRNNSLQLPPSPAPSYREFAPPSYESIIKKDIYVIPVDHNIKLSDIKENYCKENLSTTVQQQNIATNTKLEIVNEFLNDQSKTG